MVTIPVTLVGCPALDSIAKQHLLFSIFAFIMIVFLFRISSISQILYSKLPSYLLTPNRRSDYKEGDIYFCYKCIISGIASSWEGVNA